MTAGDDYRLWLFGRRPELVLKNERAVSLDDVAIDFDHRVFAHVDNHIHVDGRVVLLDALTNCLVVRPSERERGTVSFVKSLSLPPFIVSNKPSNSETCRPLRIQWIRSVQNSKSELPSLYWESSRGSV